MKKFFAEFKTFITRGNVVDLAVGVLVGSAFTAIVNALSNNVLKPIINWVLALCLGSNSLDGIYTYLKTAYVLDEAGVSTGVIDAANSIYIDWGAFINAIINFILIALVVFIIVKIINKVKELGDLDDKMIASVQAKLDADEELTKAEAKWLKLYSKAHPDSAPKKTVVEAVVEEPAPVELSTTDALLTEILAALKKDEGANA